MLRFIFRLSLLCLVWSLALSAVSAQTTTTGRLTGVVLDPQGAVVSGAQVTARQEQTQAEFKATTNDEGIWSIPSIPNGTYTVQISAANFKTTVAGGVKVDAGLPATLNVTLEPGQVSEQVVVTGGAEMLQAETATVATTITGRQISELPFLARNAQQLVLTLPGVQIAGTPRSSSVNGLPKGSINMTLDGASIQDNYLKGSDGFFTTIQPKTDAIQEVTVSTAVPGAESAGAGAVHIRFVTRSGSSEFHGGGFWQYRSPRFNANYYFNNLDGLPRDRLFLRQYGGHVGGPILIPGLLKRRDRAFFFINYEESRSTQSYSSLSTPVGNLLVLTPTARQGIFTYLDRSNANNPVVRQVNLLTLAASKGFIGTPDPKIAEGLRLIEQAVNTGGALRSRIGSANDYNRMDYQFQEPGFTRYRFPTARFDWNITDKHHVEFIHNYQNYIDSPDFVNGWIDVYPKTGLVVGNPGVAGTTYRNRFSLAAAHRWTLSNSLINEVRATGSGLGNIIFTREFSRDLFDFWGGYAVNTGTYLGAGFYNKRTGSRRNSPIYTLNDNLTWVKGTHTINTGFSYTRINTFNQSESTQTAPRVDIGLATTDPVRSGSTNIFTTTNFPGANTDQLADARTLYGILVGKFTAVRAQAVLDEETRKYAFVPYTQRNHQNDYALYAQDSWKFRPNLTLNYGLRWEIVPSPVNDNLVYGKHPNDLGGVFGVSGVNNLFRPGVYEGSPTQYRIIHEGERAYETRWKDFAPSAGFAWSPDWKEGLLGRLSGGNGQTVLRAGYSIAYTREGFAAYNLMYGSNEGPFVTLDATTSNFPSLAAGNGLFRNTPLPALAPPTGDTSSLVITAPAGSAFTSNEFDPNIRPGYTQSWTVGLQRSLGKDTALEIRYVGNHGTHLWRQYDYNEVNIFENGFLNVFKAAANNLAIFTAANPRCGQTGQPACNYGNSGLPGQVNVPIITTAIGSSTDLTTTQQLRRGEAGGIANGIANSLTRMNRLINANLVPAFTLPDGTKVSNFFIVNPQTTGTSSAAATGAFIMTNGIDTRFDAMQIELRRRLSRGLLVQANYQFGKAIANAFASTDSLVVRPRTMRDIEADRGPSTWDIRHSFKINWIYELPIGPGKALFNVSNPLMSRVLEGWQIGGVARIQSGSPQRLDSGRQTFNQNDSGVVLHNITTKQLQEMVKIRKETVCAAGTCRGVVYWLPQSIIDNTLAAFEAGGKTLADLKPNEPYIGPPTTPGELGARIFLYGPWTSRFDFNVVKRIRVTETTSLEGRVLFLNAFNKANFFLGDPDNENFTARSTSIGSSFGQTRFAYRDPTIFGTGDPGGRLMEFQLRFNF